MLGGYYYHILSNYKVGRLLLYLNQTEGPVLSEKQKEILNKSGVTPREAKIRVTETDTVKLIPVCEIRSYSCRFSDNLACYAFNSLPCFCRFLRLRGSSMSYHYWQHSCAAVWKLIH